MRKRLRVGKKLVSLLLVALMLTSSMSLFDIGVFSAKAASISVWDGENTTPNTADLNRYYPNDIYTTKENNVDTMYIKTARGLMLYANLVSNKNWFYEWYVKLDTDIDLGKAGWMGIGNGANNVFTGVFDGQGHTIYNMNITNTDDNRGFFRKVNGAVIKNVTFDNCTVSTDAYSGISHGVVVGWCSSNTCSFENVIVKKAKVYGDYYIGGIVGNAESNVKFKNCKNYYNDTYIDKKCNNTSYFVAGNDGANNNGGVGGLIGHIDNYSLEMTDCTNTTYVNIKDGSGNDFRIGGMVGRAQGALTMANCRNYGLIGNASDRHGLTGGLAGNTNSGVVVANCINYGDVYGADRVAGMVAWASGSNITFTNCYNYGTISASSEQAAAMVAYFDSDNTLSIDTCYNSGSVTATKHAAGLVGVSNGITTIKKGTNDGAITTTSDQFAAGICSYVSDDPCTFTDCTNNGIIRCGSSSTYNYAAGILADLNGSIANATHSFIRCNNNADVIGGSATGGIAGYLSGSNNPTYNFTDCANKGVITCKSGDGDVGGIAGNIASNGKINFTNTHNTGKVSSTGQTVGGLSGKAYGFVTAVNCYNTADVSGRTRVAGLFGYIQDDASSIKDSYNSGTITANGDRCAGLVASFEGNSEFTFTNCENRGAITANGAHAAGIIAITEGSIVAKNCKNTQTVTATGDYAGGIVSFIRDDASKIEASYNTADITGTSNVGGIVGKYEKSSTLALDDCYNTGKIIPRTNNTGYGGGLIGLFGGSALTVNRCYNSTTGNIGSDSKRFSRAGGLAGYVTRAYITDAYNSADIYSNTSSGNYIGGLVGESGSTDTTVRYAYNAGKLSGYSDNSYGGTLVGRYMPSVIQNAYFLKGTFTGNFTLQGTAIDVTALKSDAMTENRGQNLGNGNWKKDTENKNNGYPVLDSKNTTKSYIAARTASEGNHCASLELSINNVDYATSFDYRATGETGVREVATENGVYYKTAQYDRSRWNSSVAKVYIDPTETDNLFGSGVSITLNIPEILSRYNQRGRWGVELAPYTDTFALGWLNEEHRSVTVRSTNGKNYTYSLCDIEGKDISSAESNSDFTRDAIANLSSYGPYNRWWLKGSLPEVGDSVTFRVLGLCGVWVAQNNYQNLTEWTDLTVYSISKTELKKAINTTVFAQNNYTQGSYSTYKNALDNAKRVFASNTADQTEIDNATTALNNAINGLQGLYDFTELMALIHQAEALNPDKTENYESVAECVAQAKSTTYNSQTDVDNMVAVLKSALDKTTPIKDKDTYSATHSQNSVYNNWLGIKGVIRADGADSVKSSYFDVQNVDKDYITISETDGPEGYRTVRRRFQTDLNTSQAVYNIDRYKYSDISQLGKILYANMTTDGRWHQQELCIVKENDITCFNNTTNTYTGIKTGAPYTYSLTGGGFKYGSADGSWDTNSGKKNSEFYAGLSGELPEAGDGVVIRAMIRPAALTYNDNCLVSYYGWIDLAINAYDTTQLRQAINTNIENESLYTKSSLDAYKKALQNALIVLTDSTTQVEIDSATAKLNVAIAQLQKGTDPDTSHDAMQISENAANNIRLYTPEVIFLNTTSSAYGVQDRYNFKSFVDYDYDDETNTGELRSEAFSKGGIYFYCENATDVRVSYKYLNEDFSEMKVIKNTIDIDSTQNYANLSTNIALSGFGTIRPVNASSNGQGVYYESDQNRVSLTIDNGSFSPYLVADTRGCYIEWSVEFTLSDSGEKRELKSYTFVYKEPDATTEQSIINGLHTEERENLRKAYHNSINMFNELGIYKGESAFFGEENTAWMHFNNLYGVAGKMLVNPICHAYKKVDGVIYSIKTLETALDYGHRSITGERISSNVTAKFLELGQDNKLISLYDDVNHANVADETKPYFFGNKIVITPKNINGYDCIGYVKADVGVNDTVSADDIIPIDSVVANGSAGEPNLSYVLLYKAKVYSTIIDTKDGLFNLLHLKKTDLPTYLGGMGYPSYNADSEVETDLSYTVSGNKVTAWTDGETTAEKYQFVPMYADIQPSTDYILTYEVEGTSQDSVSLSLYNPSFAGAYTFSESGAMISSGTDSGIAYLKVELLGDARNGEKVEIKNICLSTPETNEFYQQTSDAYPSYFTATTADKMGMSYYVLNDNSVMLTSQYNSSMYTQRQLTPYYIELKPNTSYNVDYTVSGLDSSQVKVMLYNPDFTNGNADSGKSYQLTAGETVKINDDGIAQLKIQLVDGIAKDTTFSVEDIVITNAESKKAVNGTYNSTVELGIPSKENYRFAGWVLKPNGGTEVYGTLDSENNTYTFGQGIDLIEAKWIVDTLYGDVNSDGNVDAMDAVLTQCIIEGMLTEANFTFKEYAAADYNMDGTIDMSDVEMMNNSGLNI